MTNEETIRAIQERAEELYPLGVSEVDEIWQTLKRQVNATGEDFYKNDSRRT